MQIRLNIQQHHAYLEDFWWWCSCGLPLEGKAEVEPHLLSHVSETLAELGGHECADPTLRAWWRWRWQKLRDRVRTG